MIDISIFLKSIERIYNKTISENANKYIKIKRKLAIILLDIKFIKQCQINEKLPNFIRINLPTEKDLRFNRKIRGEITERQLNSKHRTKREHQVALTRLQNELTFTITQDEWNNLSDFIELKIKSDTTRKTKRHIKFVIFVILFIISFVKILFV